MLSRAALAGPSLASVRHLCACWQFGSKIKINNIFNQKSANQDGIAHKCRFDVHFGPCKPRSSEFPPRERLKRHPQLVPAVLVPLDPVSGAFVQVGMVGPGDQKQFWHYVTT